jgi:hypothetical protein
MQDGTGKRWEVWVENTCLASFDTEEEARDKASQVLWKEIDRHPAMPPMGASKWGQGVQVRDSWRKRRHTT